jgi:hypothetical protein
LFRLTVFPEPRQKGQIRERIWRGEASRGLAVWYHSSWAQIDLKGQAPFLKLSAGKAMIEIR